MTYFANKAGIEDKIDKSLDFYYNIQNNPLAGFPKITAEIESDD